MAGSDHDASSSSLPRRLRDGLERIANVMRSDRRSASDKSPLNPTQTQILDFLASQRDPGARVNAIAAHLRVSQPTTTDSIIALEKKGFLTRRADSNDRRAILVALTEAGRGRAREIGSRLTATERAIAALSESEQSALLALLVALIRNLQSTGAISPQRMCVTCKYFRPYAHREPDAPHHCAYVDAAFGSSALRLDCGEHAAAEPAAQDEAWRIYENGRAPSTAARRSAP
jgi:DNA-binding MarR family transcriptional regulator